MNTRMSDTAAAASVKAAARSLHLPTVRAQADELAEAAARDGATHRGYLAELLAAEVDERAERRRVRRTREARFPRQKLLEDFDTGNSPIDPATIATLAAGDFIDVSRPAVLLGDSGTGKTHLLIGTGMAACQAGRSVRYVTAAGLVNELVEAQDAHQLSKIVARYGRCELLLVDELGYLHLDPRGAELLFQVLTEREERASVAVATNAPFSEWANTFTDARLCAAIIDRLTFNALIIETGTDSYRLRSTRRKASR
ncbi:IS21-like element helper ATPase IstB [soil metagenome]